MDKDKTAEDGTVIYPYSYAEFEGKWLLYQKRSLDNLEVFSFNIFPFYAVIPDMTFQSESLYEFATRTMKRNL